MKTTPGKHGKLLKLRLDAIRLDAGTQVRAQYRKEVLTRPKEVIVALRWRKVTNAAGWSCGVPESNTTNGGPATERNPARPHR